MNPGTVRLIPSSADPRAVAGATLLAVALAVAACSGDDGPSSAAAPTGGAGGAGESNGSAATGGVTTIDSGMPGQSTGGSSRDAALSDAEADSASNSGGSPPGTGGASGTVDSGGVEPGIDASCGASTECRTFCQALADGADCGLEDSDVEACSCQCEMDVRPQCGTELSAVLACGGSSLTVACGDGVPAAAGCDGESQALDVCVEQAAGRLCAEQIPACRVFCDAVLGALCDGGPHSLSDCLCGCEDKMARPCPDEWSALAGCAGSDFEIACTQEGEVVVQGACESEWATLQQCL